MYKETTKGPTTSYDGIVVYIQPQNNNENIKETILGNIINLTGDNSTPTEYTMTVLRKVRYPKHPLEKILTLNCTEASPLAVARNYIFSLIWR